MSRPGHPATLRQHSRRLPGRGGPPQFPPSPSIRSAPHTPGSSSRLRFQALRRFHGLHPEFGGSALPAPPEDETPHDAAGFASCYGPHLRSPCHRASDAGLRPGPFPDRAASLLPGLLAATRTGLPPAGDDELTNSKIRCYITASPPILLGARKARASRSLRRLIAARSARRKNGEWAMAGRSMGAHSRAASKKSRSINETSENVVTTGAIVT